MWEGQRGLADLGWRVVAPHFDGFGGSTLARATSSMDQYADDVIALLRELGISSAVIGGLSMGGYAALALMRKAPELCRGLILADTRSEADTPDGLQARRNMLALVAEKGADAVATSMGPKLLGTTTQATRPDIVEYVAGTIRETPSETITAAIHALMSRRDATDLLPAIAVPTLVLVGEEDAITPPPMSHNLRDHIPQAALVTLEAAGHLSNIEQPQRFNSALADFLAHRL